MSRVRFSDKGMTKQEKVEEFEEFCESLGMDIEGRFRILLYLVLVKSYHL